MMSKGTLSVVVAVTLAFSAACQGSEDAPKADTPPPPPADPAAAATTAAPAASGEVANYANMVAQSGTVTTQQNIKVYQAADPNSTLLTTLGPGTLVERKGSYGDWMLIHWPSGVGKLSPGWVQAVYLGSVPKVVTDAGAPTDAGTPAPQDAGSAPVDAGTKPQDAGAPPADAGRRPIIKLPTK
jgi:hypothetical protein